MTAFKKIPANKKSLSKRKLIYKVGSNDADYLIQPVINGKRVKCPIYIKWKSMLSRCYSEKFQLKRPTYIGCTVCKEWLTFSNFAKWYNKNYIEGYQLDKDIKVKGNKVYSPYYCLLVPSSINNLLISCESLRGDLPLGVSFRKNRGTFISQINIDCKNKSIGCYKTPELAHSAYVKAKNAEIMRKCEQYPELAKYLINHLLEEV